jgi:hypothetical protein
MGQKTIRKHNDSKVRAVRAFASAFGISPKSLVAFVKDAQAGEEFEPRTQAKAAKQRTHKRAKENGFVNWLRDTAEERHERKRVNRALAKAIRNRKFASAKAALVAVRKHTNGGEGWLRLVENAYGRKVSAKKERFTEFSFDDGSDEDDW